MNALIDKAALITKHWKLTADTGPFYLTVRHYSMTKLYILSISGLLVLVNSKVVYRHTDPIEDKLEVPFTLSGKTGKLVIEATAETKDKKSKVFTYTLFYGSDERRADFLTDGTPGAYPEAADSCSVKAGAPQEVDGSSVQFYDLSTTVDGRARSVPKRFKEFDNLQRLVRSAYAESDELANIPRLPSKTFGESVRLLLGAWVPAKPLMETLWDACPRPDTQGGKVVTSSSRSDGQGWRSSSRGLCGYPT
jgi:hypothetical protein